MICYYNYSVFSRTLCIRPSPRLFWERGWGEGLNSYLLNSKFFHRIELLNDGMAQRFPIHLVSGGMGAQAYIR